MTRGQRTVHRVVWLLLVPMLAAVLIVAVWHRADASSRPPVSAPARGVRP